MSYLPAEALELHGGCFCSKIRYTISLPSRDERPLIPGAVPIPVDGSEESPPARFPYMDIDHCSDCRRACGSIVQAWIIIPHAWVKWQLEQKDGKGKIDVETGDVVLPSDELKTKTFIGHFNSSEDVQRAFCSFCGTPLTFCYTGPRTGWTLGPMVDIGMGSLDTESLEKEGVRVDRHGWWDDGVSWVKDLLRHGDGGKMLRHPTGSTKTIVKD